MKANGFTLVEMLVALLIFGMLAAAGVSLLSFSVRAQEMSDRALRDLTEVRRIGALLAADLAQAAPRPYRDEAGTAHRPFGGGAGEVALSLVRRGWHNHDGSARPTLQRVEYRFGGGRLERTHYLHVDGAAAARAVPLLDNVSALTIRFRDSGGAWHERWTPEDAAALPAAVELTVTAGTRGTIRQLFLVGAGA